MSDIYLIDVDRLKSSKNDYRYYNNRAYNTFSSCYIRKCSNAQVKKMLFELQNLYDKITD